MKAKNGIAPIVSAKNIPGLIIPNLLRFICEDSLAFSEESPFNAKMAYGDPRLSVVVGPNASGKSLMHRIIQGLAQTHKIEAITLSIRERTGCDEPPGSMRRQFMYGFEQLDSTGNVSLRTTKKAFETMAGRTAPVMLLLDEPEIGLSEGFAHAFGELIGRLASEPPEWGCGVMVISHSRPLVRGLSVGLGACPTYVATADAPDTLEEWNQTTETRSIEELEQLSEISSTRRAAVRELLSI